MKRYIQAGANIIGGHAGVGEAHIKAINNAIRMTQAASRIEQVQAQVVGESVDAPKAAAPLVERSKLGQALGAKKRIFTVEIIPPRGIDCAAFFNLCAQLLAAGIEFVNIPLMGLAQLLV